MSDRSWNPTPPGWFEPKPLAPKPRLLLFEFHHGGAHYRCELLDHGEFGTEAQVTKDGELLTGKTFETSLLAALWAHDERKRIEAGA